ncbi:MAG: hypothetical protein RL409_949 [Gemmatimonadota bacterium]
MTAIMVQQTKLIRKLHRDAMRGAGRVVSRDCRMGA